MSFISRQDYMSGKVSFATYYRHLARLAGIAFNSDDPFIQRVRLALESGDEHLNSIPLNTWDLKSMAAKVAITRACRQVEGEFWSMAIGVCVMKQAATDAANGVRIAKVK